MSLTELKIIYNGVNITADISEELISVSFTDNLRGQADDIQIEVHNNSKKWYGPFKPEKGDIIELQIGDLLCGAFQVDAIQYSLFPRSVFIGGQSAKVYNKSVIQRLNRVYENTSFFSAIRDLSGVLGLNPEFYCDDVTIEREVFMNERINDIVKHLSGRYGYIYKITNRTGIYGEIITDKLVVIDPIKLNENPVSFEIEYGSSTIAANTCIIEDVSKVFNKKKVLYRNPKNRILTQTFVEDTNDLITPDMAEETEVVEGNLSKQQVAKKAKMIRKQEKLRGSLSMKGNASVVAGAIFSFVGWDYNESGTFLNNRKFIIKKAVHNYTTTGGWTVDIEFKNI